MTAAILANLVAAATVVGLLTLVMGLPARLLTPHRAAVRAVAEHDAPHQKERAAA